MQTRGMDWVALSNGRGQIAGSPAVKEVECLELSSHLRFDVIVSNTVTTRLLRRERAAAAAVSRLATIGRALAREKCWATQC